MIRCGARATPNRVNESLSDERIPGRRCHAGGVSMSDLDEVLERANECRREAARSTNAADVIAWLSLADEWRRLGESGDPDVGSPCRSEDAPFAFI